MNGWLGFEASLGTLRAALGPSRGGLGLSWGALGWSADGLGCSWADLQPSCGDHRGGLGLSKAGLRLPWGRSERACKCMCLLAHACVHASAVYMRVLRALCVCDAYAGMNPLSNKYVLRC